MWGRLVADVAHALLRAVSRHLLFSLTRCASHARGPGVEKSPVAARRSACATSATTCPTLAHPVSSTSGGLSLVYTWLKPHAQTIRSSAISRHMPGRAAEASG